MPKPKKRANTGKQDGLRDFIDPQLCELVQTPPVGSKWVHEPKLDGYRTQLHVRKSKVILYSRRGLDWTHRFPEIAEAAADFDDIIIDGEICAVGSDGLPSFAGLTDALKSKKTGGLVYYVFDMMGSDGENIMQSPLLERKNALKHALKTLTARAKKRFSYVSHEAGDGAKMHKAACRMGLEGIVSKIADAPYLPNNRSGIWTKAKCRASQELVIAGWKMTGAAFRSLVVGAHRGGKFVHVGTVGTGYNSRNLPELLKALEARATDKRPFENVRGPKEGKDIHWVKPTLVIEAEIASWTSDGLIRQSSYKGMREDKLAKSVVVETPHRPPKA